jgi:cation diffusion facilitator family transporter
MFVEIVDDGSTPPSSDRRSAHDKGFVAATSVAAAVALTGMKLAVGLATGSLGILSEALHSALDLVAALVTLFAVRASARPADTRHPFGHGKVENLSALFETVLLLLTCGWIVNEATQRLAGGNVRVEATAWAFVVMAVSIAVDFSRSRALLRVARRTGSQALEADALHFSTDVWSSSVVILGLVAVRLAPALEAPWLVQADAIAALGVAGIVVWISLRLGRRTVGDLLDEVPPGLRERVEEAARVTGVLDVGRVRVRRSGADYFVDLTLSAEPAITLEHAHRLAERVEHSVRTRLPGADVLVHLEPANDGGLPIPSPSGVRSIARTHGLDINAVRVVAGPVGPTLELHVEVDPELDLAAAHIRASELEMKLLRRFPGLAEIVSHIEPRGESTPPPEGSTEEAIQMAVEEVVRGHGYRCRACEVAVVHGDHGLVVSCRCATEPHAATTDVHQLSAAVDSALRERFPDVDQVTILLQPIENA